MDSLKDTIRDMQEIIQHLEAENKELRDALGSSKKKLELYRNQHSGEYIGGMEYTALIKCIDKL